MQETFNDHRLGDADRMTHASKHDQDLGDADDPAGHVHDGAGKEIGTTGVDRGEVLVDGIDRAEHPPLSVASKAPDDDVQNALPAATLHQIEAGEHDSAKAQAGRGHPSQRRVRSERDQQQKADNSEHKLSCRLQQNVDDHAGGRERAGNPVEPQQARADDVAADLRHGQQDIGGLTNKSQEHACLQPRPRLRRKDEPPARSGHRYRDAAHHHDEKDSPPDAGDRVPDRFQPGPRRDGDDGGDSDQPGSNAGLLDHLRSDPHKARLMPHLRRATRAI